MILWNFDSKSPVRASSQSTLVVHKIWKTTFIEMVRGASKPNGSNILAVSMSNDRFVAGTAEASSFHLSKLKNSSSVLVSQFDPSTLTLLLEGSVALFPVVNFAYDSSSSEVLAGTIE